MKEIKLERRNIGGLEAIIERMYCSNFNIVLSLVLLLEKNEDRGSFLGSRIIIYNNASMIIYKTVLNCNIK